MTDPCTAAMAALFNHRIGAYDQVVWNGDAECFGCLEIDRQIKFRGLFYGNVTGLFALQDFVDVISSSQEKFGNIWSVGEQSAQLNKEFELVKDWNPVFQTKVGEPLTNYKHYAIADSKQRLGRGVQERLKRCIDISNGSILRNPNRHLELLSCRRNRLKMNFPTWIRRIANHGHTRQLGQHLFHDLDALDVKLRRHAVIAGNIAAGISKALVKAGPNSIMTSYDDDGNCTRRLLGGESAFAQHCNDNVRVEAHQIGSHPRQQFRFPLSEPQLDFEVFSFGISKLFEPIDKNPAVGARRHVA